MFRVLHAVVDHIRTKVAAPQGDEEIQNKKHESELILKLRKMPGRGKGKGGGSSS